MRTRSTTSADQHTELVAPGHPAPRHPHAVLAALQRHAGNRAVAQLVGGTGPVVQRVPATAVSWQEITKTDTEPVPPALAAQNPPTSFRFGHIMDADPLTTDPGGLVGSKPKGKSDWWPHLQARHSSTAPKGQKIYWVQGHLLNDNVHGPGEPKNLVPLSNTSNTNMETTGERAVKKAVAAGKVVHYRVEAVWDTEPADRRRAYGLVAEGGSLLWGEQFAPSAIVWTLTEKLETSPGSGTWVDGATLHQNELGWYNTFPQPAQQHSAKAPATARVNVLPVNTSARHALIVSGTGFTPNGPVKVAYLNLPGYEGQPPQVVGDVASATGAFRLETAFTQVPPSSTAAKSQVYVNVQDGSQGWDILAAPIPVTRIWT